MRWIKKKYDRKKNKKKKLTYFTFLKHIQFKKITKLVLHGFIILLINDLIEKQYGCKRNII